MADLTRIADTVVTRPTAQNWGVWTAAVQARAGGRDCVAVLSV